MNPKKYPRYITLNGEQVLVQNPGHHFALTGIEYDENAEPVVKRPTPPTVEEIVQAGYELEAAMRIHAREGAKAEQGIEPYGDKPDSEFVPPAPAVPPAPVAPPAPAAEQPEAVTLFEKKE